MSRNETDREIYNWRKSHKICTKCGKEDAKKNHTLCWRCLANRNDYSRVYYHTQKKRSDEQRARDAECRKQYVGKRFADNLCFRCGKYPPIGDSKYSMCVYCNAKESAKRRENRHKNGTLPQVLRGNGLYCTHCCKPVCNGEKLCPECYEKACKNVSKAKANTKYEHPWRTAWKPKWKVGTK